MAVFIMQGRWKDKENRCVHLRLIGMHFKN